MDALFVSHVDHCILLIYYFILYLNHFIVQGYTKNPTYQEVCTGKTGHTEAVLVAYDTSKVSYYDWDRSLDSKVHVCLSNNLSRFYCMLG